MADQTGGQDPGVVEYQTVPLLKKGGQVIEVVVADGPGPLVQGQQPGRIPLGDGRLGDQLRGQFVVKIMCFNKYPSLSCEVCPSAAGAGTPSSTAPLPHRTSGGNLWSPGCIGCHRTDSSRQRLFFGRRDFSIDRKTILCYLY